LPFKPIYRLSAESLKAEAMMEGGTSSTALVPASTALQPLTQNPRSNLDESMLGHLVQALDGNQSARPMLQDARTGATLMDMHIGPPMSMESMAPLIGNVGGDSDQNAVIQAAAEYQA
jgi:hypothetical protein